MGEGLLSQKSIKEKDGQRTAWISRFKLRLSQASFSLLSKANENLTEQY